MHRLRHTGQTANTYSGGNSLKSPVAMERERQTHTHAPTHAELMKLSSTHPFHNPTEMLISCGSLTAKTHRYTHLHTHFFFFLRDSMIVRGVWEVRHSVAASRFMVQLAG